MRTQTRVFGFTIFALGLCFFFAVGASISARPSLTKDNSFSARLDALEDRIGRLEEKVYSDRPENMYEQRTSVCDRLKAIEKKVSEQ